MLMDHGDRDKEVKERLNGAWEAGKIDEACGILIHEVEERVVKYLVFTFQGKLSDEDCEECFDCAVGKLVEHHKNPEGIRNAYSYVWTCAVNEAKDMLTELSQVVRYDPDWIESDDEETDTGVTPPLKTHKQDASELVFTEIVLDAEIEESRDGAKVKEVIDLAVSRLTKQCRELVGILREEDPFMKPKVIAERLGKSGVATRQLKLRLFRDLKELIPQAALELGVDLNKIIKLEPEVLRDKENYLSLSEDDTETIPPII